MPVSNITNTVDFMKYFLFIILICLCQGIPFSTKDFVKRYPCLEYNVCECSEGIYDPPYSDTVTVDCRARNLTKIPALVDLDKNKYYRLWLRDNYIQLINSRDFSCDSIVDIDIGGYNQIRYVAAKALKVTNRFLQKLTLNISSLNIYKLRFLHAVPTLYELTIEGNNKLHKISSRLLPGYKMKTLRMLSLMHCGIEKIAWDAFLGVSNVKELHLSHNHLTNVPSDSLMGLHHLTKLDLSFNRLTTLDGQSFTQLFKLSEIDLTGNDFTEMQEIPSDVFKDQEASLHKLILSNTFISTIPTEAIQNLQELKTLNISYNKINELNNNTQPFLGLKLQVLDISGNNIPLEATLLNGLENTLFKLFLRDMNITSLPYTLLKKLGYLYELDISGNIMPKLPDYFNKGLSVRHFILRRMNIKKISSRAFTKPSEIAELSIDVESNFISSIDFIRNSPACTFHYLNLMANPINCDCILYELIVDRTIRFSGTCSSISQNLLNLSFTSNYLQRMLQQKCSPRTFNSHCRNEYKSRLAPQTSGTSLHTYSNIFLLIGINVANQLTLLQ
ncbi:insulin-like growth factor-binding protein complex acid labile subunit [Octopus bimaculoides]|uniref:LRRCT domain-containing protein n=1 Tax=Octopus bimaculoides TaxID=37653 RepID=A0A0L8GXP0_OCTBM|nr:insulin-like growth factor-binding protein complex acid labile subunit [Octopus bimaculoides]|eukprot:XP_014777455.1 PREDICTED: insulin-like growth factor-binding protein complex acid labile subunit isoform X1 [Octopus bimaculoides]